MSPYLSCLEVERSEIHLHLLNFAPFTIPATTRNTIQEGVHCLILVQDSRKLKDTLFQHT